MKRLIDNVPAQVIEPIVLSKLPYLFTPSRAWRMEKEVVADIAGESTIKQNTRIQLNTKLSTLKASEATCKRYAARLEKGGYSRNHQNVPY